MFNVQCSPSGPLHPPSSILHPLRGPHARRGFTLIEILVVITIIGILATIAISVIGNTLAGAREAATKATIAKIDGLVQERIRAIDQHRQSAAFRKRVEQVARRLGVTGRTAEILAIKEDMRAAFNYPPPAGSNEKESGKLLYEALTKQAVFGLAPVDTDTFKTSEILSDSADDNRVYFIDGWGRPLRFYLWPTRLVRPGGFPTSHAIDPTDADEVALHFNRPLVDLLIPGLSTDLLQTDPDDPQNHFANWAARAGQAQGFDVEAVYHTPNTYHVPLIVSAGADNELGLYEPHENFPSAGTISIFGETISIYGRLAQPRLDTDGDGTDDWALHGGVPDGSGGTLPGPADGPLNDNLTNHERAGG